LYRRPQIFDSEFPTSLNNLSGPFSRDEILWKLILEETQFYG